MVGTNSAAVALHESMDRTVMAEAPTRSARPPRRTSPSTSSAAGWPPSTCSAPSTSR
ncbi:hypothetical protein ID875_26175 [Streptomyces globisporus]|uniref:Uncharacterized protein n=1 Tax=Streptomyces globisporus TaxID=1908 RepID=A0A927BP46_STRGL|nr:hypothetical protein [Streptomyces globisporus]